MKNAICLTILLLLFQLPVQAIEIVHESGTSTFEQTPTKIVALDWALTETLLALDVQPIAVADIKGYNEWVTFPEIPAGVTDVGNRREPNLELLSSLKPDVILINDQMIALLDQLNEIAPTIVLSVYTKNKQPLSAAKIMTTQLGKLFDKQTEAQLLIKDTDDLLVNNGKILNNSSKALLFVRFLNQSTLRVHSDGSLVHDTITRMGIKNSWDEKTNIWGFSKVGIEKLAKHQQARLMILGPVKKSDKEKLFSTPLWNAMQFSRDKSVHILPPIWTFGSLIAAQRFSNQMVETLAKSN